MSFPRTYASCHKELQLSRAVAKTQSLQHVLSGGTVLYLTDPTPVAFLLNVAH